MDTYDNSGEIRYAGLWKKVDGVEFVEYHGVDGTSHQRTFEKLSKDKWIPICISVVSLKGRRYWSAIYERSDTSSFVVRSTLPVSDFERFRDHNRKLGRQVSYLNGYNHNGRAYFVVIATSKGHVGLSYQHGVSAQTLRNKHDVESGSGRLMHFITGYEEDSTRKYASSWR